MKVKGKWGYCTMQLVTCVTEPTKTNVKFGQKSVTYGMGGFVRGNVCWFVHSLPLSLRYSYASNFKQSDDINNSFYLFSTTTWPIYKLNSQDVMMGISVSIINFSCACDRVNDPSLKSRL